MRSNTLFLMLALLFSTSRIGYSQLPFDCIEAMKVCDHATINIDYEDVSGDVEEDFTDFCTIESLPSSILSENTIWFKYQFKTSGDFQFTITPSTIGDDVDFVVFSSASKTCDDLIPIRCMFTGYNFMANTDSICYGPTGLATSSLDTFEEPGCQIGDDNFLAPIDVVAGDVLYLAVKDFSMINTYSIQHMGSAEISCDLVNVENSFEENLKIYPNPTSDLVQIEVTNNHGQEYTVELFNLSGQKVLQQTFKNKINLDVSLLSSGVYFANIISSDSRLIRKKILITAQ